MHKDTRPVEAKPKPTVKLEPLRKGRFVGLVGSGDERYQVHLIETEGDKVTRREVLVEGRIDTIRGSLCQGESLAVAKSAFHVQVGKHLTDVTDLWRK